ncbi:baseplate hub [Burkholderia phage Bm1]
MASPLNLFSQQRALEVWFQTPDKATSTNADDRSTYQVYTEDFNIEVDMSCNIIECWRKTSIKIYNLNRDLRNKLISSFNPWTARKRERPYCRLMVKIGRRGATTPLSTIFTGVITKADQTMPPEICVMLEAETSYEYLVKSLAYAPLTGRTTAKQALQKAADLMGLTLRYEAVDGLVIHNYLEAPDMRAVPMLMMTYFPTRLQCFTDGVTLWAITPGTPIKGSVYELNDQTGLLEQPRMTEWGVYCKALADVPINLASSFNLTSKLVPVSNGNWTTYKIDYRLQSRGNDWFANLYASPPALGS